VSHFVYDNTSLSYPKTDLQDVPPGADPTKYVAAEDWNLANQAAVDLRDAVRNGRWYGFAAQSSDPAPGVSNYLWLDTAGHLYLKRPSLSYFMVPSTRQVTAGDGLSGGGALDDDIEISHPDTAVTPDTYDFATITVDQRGHITGASAGSAVPPGRKVDSGDGLSGGGDLSADRTLSLSASGVSPGEYTLATITVDTYGRVTEASSGGGSFTRTLKQAYGDGASPADSLITLDDVRRGIIIRNASTPITDPLFAVRENNGSDLLRVDGDGRVVISNTKGLLVGDLADSDWLIHAQADTVASIGASSYWTGAITSPWLSLRKGRGTHASPLHVLADDQLGHVKWFGHNTDGVVADFRLGAHITAVAAEDFTTDPDWYNGTDLLFYVAAKALGGAPTERLRIPASGGVQFPSQGTAAVSDANTGRFRYNSSGQVFQVSMNGGDYVNLVTGTVDLSGYALLAGRSGGQILIGGTGAADDLVLRATAGAGASGSDIIFQVGNNGATEAMRINYDGKVGIGTASPSHLLDVVGSVSGDTILHLQNTHVAGYSAFDFVDSIGAVGATVGYSNASATYFPGSLWMAARKTGEPLIFATPALAEMARFTSAGRLGIGTTAPAVELHVHGSGGRQVYVSTVAPGLILGDNLVPASATGFAAFGLATGSNNYVTGSAANDVCFTSNTGALLFGTDGSYSVAATERMRLSPVGGASSGAPVVQINATDVSAYVNALRFLAPSLTASQHVAMNFGVAASEYNFASLNFKYAGAGSSSNSINLGFYGHDDLFTILGDGKVGIGTSSPDTLLDVHGDVTLNGVVSGTDALIHFQEAGTEKYTIGYYTSGSTDGFRIYNPGRGSADLFIQSSTGQMQLPDGSQSVPILSFNDDVNTGICREYSDSISFVTGGATNLQIMGGGKIYHGKAGTSTQYDLGTGIKEGQVWETRHWHQRLGDATGTLTSWVGFAIQAMQVGCVNTLTINEMATFFVNGAPIKKSDDNLTQLNQDIAWFEDDTVGTTQAVQVLFSNETPATTGAQKYSPLITQRGFGFAETGSLSKSVEFATQVQPVQSTGSSSDGNLVWMSRVNGSIDGGAWTSLVTMNLTGKVGIGTSPSELLTLNAGTSPAIGLLIDMTQPGSAGTRDSHALVMRGTSYDTGGHNADWKQFVDVTSNSGGSQWTLQTRIDSGSYVSQLVVTNTGYFYLSNNQNHTIKISRAVDEAGHELIIEAGDAPATGNYGGGDLTLRAGAPGENTGTIPTGGSLHLEGGGSESYKVNGGHVYIQGGPGWDDTNKGGNVYIAGGVQESAGVGGGVYLGYDGYNDFLVGFFGAAPVAQQTSGADLTNNVTSGGTSDVVDNFTDLSVYSNSAQAIRDAIYQLTRKLKQLNDGLRDLGLFS